MLRIWIGRARSGKSARVLQEIAEMGDQGQQILIVPEHASHQAEIDLCRACGDTVSRHAEVLSFRLLASRVLALTGGLAQVALDQGGKLLTMEKALTEMAPMLKVYRRPSQRVAFLESLQGLVDEFYSYAVSPRLLAERVEEIDGSGREKLQDLALLYAAYDAKLHRPGLDARDRMTRMNDSLEASGYLTGKDIFIDGFTYFNGQELKALSVMLRQSRSVTVTLLGDREDPGGIFAESLRTREELLRMAREAGTEGQTLWIEGKEETALDHLERHFFGKPVPCEKTPVPIRILQADTLFSEVEQVAAQIRRIVASGRYRYRDITVAARNMEEYEAAVENVFERYQIPIFQNRRSDILQKPVLTLVVGVLDAISGDFTYEDMFRFLKTGMAGISTEECDILENYVIRWDISGTMWLREADWEANPDGYGGRWEEAQQTLLAEINRIRHVVQKPLSELFEEINASDQAECKVKALYRYLERIGLQQAIEARMQQLYESDALQTAEEYSQLWEILMEVLDQFAEILKGQTMDTEEFAKLMRLILTQYSVGTIPVSLDQVTVSEITRNDRHAVKVLFLMGANDHVLPAVDSGGGLLNEEDREALAIQGIRLAPTGMAQFSIELQNLYAALAQPTEELYVSYPVCDVAGTQLRPSFVIGRIQTLFPAVAVEKESAEKEYRLTAPLPAMEEAGRHPNGALWREFAGSPELEAMERAAAYRRGRLSPQMVRTLYGTTMRMSASRMDKLRSCHFAYFMQYGLRAKERSQARFDAPEVGTFLHHVIEHVTRETARMGGFGQVSSKQLRQMIDRCIEEYAAREYANFQDRSARFHYLFRRLRRTVTAVVEDVAEELRHSDFVPLAFELDFSAHGDLPGITISEADTQVHVAGKVDRVDGWLRDGKLYLRVVDYKTGKKSFDLSEIQHGIGIQMLLYLFTLQKEGASYFGHPIAPAGVLYLPARDVILNRDRDISQEKIAEDIHKELRRQGMILNAPEVLTAMEHDALTKPHYLPLVVGRDGTWKEAIPGALASAEEIGKLGTYVEKLLRQIAQELQQGVIDADPCCHSEEDAYCQYCEFASACHFEDGRDRDHLTYLRPVDRTEFWRTVKGERADG